MPQANVVLRNCGVIDPRDIRSYLDQGGFDALTKARREMTPDSLIHEIKKSGLRGRGGAGFPCGLKWEGARNSPENEKYVICNADEGEVGTFKDRYILEHDPFSLIEGLALAGYAVGASHGYIYLRAEYHRLLDILTNAISQVQSAGFLENFSIHVREGAGAYVCGEESALMESIEGKRGESRYRPPFPTVAGLWQKPTTINNVETLMNVPPIVRNGSEWYAGMGTERSKGTKVFSVSGDVANPGVYEMVLGSSLREIIDDIAAAVDIKLVQIGGATGRILPYSMTDTPLSFETVLGAGAITLFDNSRDVIDIAHRTMEFLTEESCGKCTPCRQGTQVLLEMMEKFSQGKGAKKDLLLIKELADTMMIASLCGLGQAAPFCVLDTMQYFPEDYQKRISD